MLNPSMSAHKGWRTAVTRGIAPLRVSTFWPAREPRAMREAVATACSGCYLRASSPSVSG
jgi:hypothetical protein